MILTGRFFFLAGLILLLVTASQAEALQQGDADTAQEPPARYGEGPENADKAQAIFKKNKVLFKNDANVLVLPGLVARKKEKRIEVLAESTGLAPDTIVEFLLIDQSSGRGYESLLWSYACPSDIHRALVFIGVAPGKPFSPNELRFWPRGERILLSVAPEKKRKGNEKPVRLERLVVDRETNKPLPETGFVFVGSKKVGSPDGKSGLVYAADAYEPKSIASLFNDPTAVLDVPRQVSQGEVYGQQLVSSEFDFAKNELVTITIEPEYRDGRQRVKDLTLQIRHRPITPANKNPPGANLEFILTDANGRQMTESPDLAAAFGVFSAMTRRGQDPFVSILFDEALTLAEVKKVCRILAMIDRAAGIRIEPPARGQLYYRAFLPDGELLERKERIFQPFELVLSKEGKGLSGTLVQHEQTWTDDRPDPDLKITRRKIPTPNSLRKELDADARSRAKATRRPSPRILLVFVNEQLQYGDLVRFLQPALTTHNIIHVFEKDKFLTTR